ncbi:MAG: DUF3570 domain-containing protein, partial [Aromatoleum sp.]|nr:DUF3570 domain-containing protein [Aromatoleum sp.]
AGAAPAATGQAGALLAAALALPGMMPAAMLSAVISSALSAVFSTPAHAESVPDASQIALKHLDYRDWQPGADRMRVKSPALYVLKPLSDSLAIEGTLVYDGMSGASPRYHNALSGASGEGVKDYRTAGDIRLTRYFDRVSVGVGAAVSSERDYLSRALSLDVRISTPDNNRTWAFGLAGTGDRINSNNGVADHQNRHTYDLLVGVTQVLSANAIVQSNLTYSTGHGYYSDPYKLLDARPDHRQVLAWLNRANQYLPAFDATLKLSYRFLADSFGGRSNMAEAAWVQALSDGWSVTPSLRYYTQSAADFYFDPPFPRGFVPGRNYTTDTRLSAFGAFTPGIGIVKRFAEGWSADLKLEFYRQKSGWRLGGGDSPGLEAFSARWIQAGIARTF